MNKNNFKIIEPSNNLYDRIILAIQREKENQKIRKVFILFSVIFVFSLFFTLFSIWNFIQVFKNSSAYYISLTIISDFSLFISFWKQFALAFIETLPLNNLIIFIFCLTISVFSLRLIFYKKYLLIKTLLK